MDGYRDVLSLAAIAVAISALVLGGVSLGLNRIPGPAGPEGGQGEQGESGPTTVWSTVDEPAGANCPNGGNLIRWGPDANGNRALEATEVAGSTYLCSWRPAWPPPPCEVNCSWQNVRTFTQSGGRLDTVNVTGTQTRAVWSVSSGSSCRATLTVSWHHYDGASSGLDEGYYLVSDLPGARSDVFNFPSSIYPGSYEIYIGVSNSCGGTWSWSVQIQEWR